MPEFENFRKSLHWIIPGTIALLIPPLIHLRVSGLVLEERWALWAGFKLLSVAFAIVFFQPFISMNLKSVGDKKRADLNSALETIAFIIYFIAISLIGIFIDENIL